MLGTAVGDAIGLPYEAISPRRAARLFGPPDRHRFLPGRGMVSDDTEHTCIVAQALAASAGDPDRFARRLAWGLRWWLLGLPAGIGLATMRATLRLWIGFGPGASGVHSAGNGPAMRAAIIGAAVEDIGRLRELVRIATRVTHVDPRAEHGAFAVALAANLACRDPSLDSAAFVARLESCLKDAAATELLRRVRQAAESAAAGEPTASFARSLGLAKGVTGFVDDTVPVCLHAWLAHRRDYRAAVMAIVGCGGDTDTCAAIVGGIVGAEAGPDAIPQDWREGLFEWPRTVAWMERAAEAAGEALARGAPRDPPRLFGPWVLARNAAFTAIVLAHVVRRCLPPY